MTIRSQSILGSCCFCSKTRSFLASSLCEQYACDDSSLCPKAFAWITALHHVTKSCRLLTIVQTISLHRKDFYYNKNYSVTKNKFLSSSKHSYNLTIAGWSSYLRISISLINIYGCLMVFLGIFLIARQGPSTFFYFALYTTPYAPLPSSWVIIIVLLDGSRNGAKCCPYWLLWSSSFRSRDLFFSFDILLFKKILGFISIVTIINKFRSKNQSNFQAKYSSKNHQRNRSKLFDGQKKF